MANTLCLLWHAGNSQISVIKAVLSSSSICPSMSKATLPCYYKSLIPKLAICACAVILQKSAHQSRTQAVALMTCGCSQISEMNKK